MAKLPSLTARQIVSGRNGFHNPALVYSSNRISSSFFTFTTPPPICIHDKPHAWDRAGIIDNAIGNRRVDRVLMGSGGQQTSFPNMNRKGAAPSVDGLSFIVSRRGEADD